MDLSIIFVSIGIIASISFGFGNKIYYSFFEKNKNAIKDSVRNDIGILVKSFEEKKGEERNEFINKMIILSKIEDFSTNKYKNYFNSMIWYIIFMILSLIGISYLQETGNIGYSNLLIFLFAVLLFLFLASLRKLQTSKDKIERYLVDKEDIKKIFKDEFITEW